VQGSSRTTLGTLHAEGRVSTLFIDHPTSATQIELVDRGKDVERARML
jgi:hypothetical protein